MAIDFSKSATEAQSAKSKNTQITVFGLGEKPIAHKDLQTFTEQLALMLETGTDLYTSLAALAEQTDNPSMQQVIKEVSESIQGGKSFAQGLAEHPKVFPSTYVGLVKASEEGGYLHRVLELSLIHI